MVKNLTTVCTVHPEKFHFYMDTSSTSRGYPRLRILRKRARKSIDLEEYIFLEPKNFFQLQKFRKLRRAPFGQKGEDFFNRNMLDNIRQPDRDSPDLT